MAAATKKVKRFLPFEIIEVIVLKLPVKALMRFKSVSKQWYSIISSDSQFAKLYHQNLITKSALLYRPKLEEANLYKVVKFNTQNIETKSLDIPLKDCTKLLCWSEGTFLFGNKKNKQKFVLWNQSTGDYRKFSSRNRIAFGGVYNINSFGLYYDAANYDYKVVCVYNYLIRSCLFYVVYSCNNNSWSKEKESSIHGFMNPRLPLKGIFANGLLHWKYEICHFDPSTLRNNVYSYEEDNKMCEICCFDPKDGKLKEFSLPECFDPDRYFQLSALEGELCISRYSKDLSMVEIWTMKDSWTKLITIDNAPTEIYHVSKNKVQNYGVKPVFMIDEGTLVFTIHEYIFIYSTKDKRFDHVKFEFDQFEFDQVIYDESKIIDHQGEEDLIPYFHEEIINQQIRLRGIRRIRRRSHVPCVKNDDVMGARVS